MQADAGRGQSGICGVIIDGSANPERYQEAKWRHELAKTFGRSDTESLWKTVTEACHP